MFHPFDSYNNETKLSDYFMTYILLLFHYMFSMYNLCIIYLLILYSKYKIYVLSCVFLVLY